MKQHNKTLLQQRNMKLQPFAKSASITENANSLEVERKLNYLPEPNREKSSLRVSRRSRRQQSSEGGGSQDGGHKHRRKHHSKKTSQMKLKDEVGTKMSRPKISTIASFLQSPRRNGLSPRKMIDEEDEEDEETRLSRSIQNEFNQHLGHTNRRSHISIKHLHKPTYSCSSCGAQFHIKSLLGAHRRTHDDDFKVRFRARRVRESTTTLISAGKQCKFCDRVFDLERALHIHQMCHCNKITPQQRRKLGYTDLAHEKKNTPLPNFQRMPRGALPSHTTPDPNMPYVALGPAAIKMIEQEQQQQKAKRRSIKYTVKVAGPMGRWR